MAEQAGPLDDAKPQGSHDDVSAPNPSKKPGRRFGGLALAIHGLFSGCLWAAVGIQSSATRHALGALVALGYATLGLYLLPGSEKYRAWSVRYSTAVACTALLASIAGTPSEVTALNEVGGVVIIIMLAGKPGKVRFGIAALSLAACDMILLIGALRRGVL